jgi:hypothetical protein
VAFLGDADGHGFVFVGIEAADYGRGGSERNLVFAGASAEKDAYAEAFLVWSHGRYFFRKIRGAKEERSGRFPEEG